MVMSIGLGWAAPIPVVKYEQPTVKGQIASPAKLLSYFEASTNPEGNRGGVNQRIKEILSEKQLAKLAKGKPIGVAMYLREKAEETSLFVTVPFTSEKDGIAFIETAGFKLEADKNNAGLSYLVPIGRQDVNEMYRIKFVSDIAFIGINVKPEAFAANKLLPYTAIVDEKNSADIFVEATPALVPKSGVDWLKSIFGKGKQSVAQMQANPGGMPKEFPDFATNWLDWMTRNLEALHTQADTVSIAINVDEKTLNNSLAMTVKPKAKSELATSIAKHPVSEGRFHQLLTDKIVVGKSLSITGTPKDLGKNTIELILWQIDQGKTMIPVLPVRDLCSLASDQLKAQAAIDKVDFAVALNDANDNGLFTGIVALAVPDPANLEKTWKTAVADWAKEDKDLVKLDAEKIGDVNIHTITYKTVSKEIADTLGKEVVIRIGFGAKAMFMTVGPDGGKLIETAAALKSKPSRVMGLDYHNGRLKVFASKLGMPAGELTSIDVFFGKGDGGKLPFFDLSVTPGETLVVTWKQNRMGILQIFGGLFSMLL